MLSIVCVYIYQTSDICDPKQYIQWITEYSTHYICSFLSCFKVTSDQQWTHLTYTHTYSHTSTPPNTVLFQDPLTKMDPWRHLMPTPLLIQNWLIDFTFQICFIYPVFSISTVNTLMEASVSWMNYDSFPILSYCIHYYPFPICFQWLPKFVMQILSWSLSQFKLFQCFTIALRIWLKLLNIFNNALCSLAFAYLSGLSCPVPSQHKSFAYATSCFLEHFIPCPSKSSCRTQVISLCDTLSFFLVSLLVCSCLFVSLLLPAFSFQSPDSKLYEGISVFVHLVLPVPSE